MRAVRDMEAKSVGPVFGPELRLLDAIASWCGGLHGSMPLAHALKAISKGLDADAGLIARDIRNDGRCRLAAIYDSREEDVDAEHLRRSFSSDVLGQYYNKIRVSTVWYLSHNLTDVGWSQSDALKSWTRARGIGDIAVISLAATAAQNDYLELHFKKEIMKEVAQEVDSIIPTLIRSWAGRKTGLVTQAQIDDRILKARASAKASALQTDAQILGVDNPANLSRAEFRVCLLLSRGLSVKGVTDELSLSEATIRSHLRNIYAKTNTHGHAELIYRILSAKAEPVQERSVTL